MKHKANLIAVAAFVCGIAGFRMYTSQLEAELRGGEPQAVLLVTEDLKAGDTLTQSNLSTTRVPSDYVDSRRVLAKERDHLLGVQVSGELQAGTGLLWSDIADGAAHKHLAALVTPGRRAYTVESGANPLGRLLRVADHVDVLLETSQKTETLLEQVLVLAVGGQIRRDDGLLGDKTVRGSGVTLSVSPEQAEQLLEAESRGKLRLVLRNPEDERIRPKQPAGDVVATAPQKAAEDSTPEIEHVR